MPTARTSAITGTRSPPPRISDSRPRPHTSGRALLTGRERWLDAFCIFLAGQRAQVCRRRRDGDEPALQGRLPSIALPVGAETPRLAFPTQGQRRPAHDPSPRTRRLARGLASSPRTQSLQRNRREAKMATVLGRTSCHFVARPRDRESCAKPSCSPEGCLDAPPTYARRPIAGRPPVAWFHTKTDAQPGHVLTRVISLMSDVTHLVARTTTDPSVKCTTDACDAGSERSRVAGGRSASSPLGDVSGGSRPFVV